MAKTAATFFANSSQETHEVEMQMRCDIKLMCLFLKVLMDLEAKYLKPDLQAT